MLINGQPWQTDPDRDPRRTAPVLALYRNLGDGTFTDVTDAAGLHESMYGMGVTAADYDNDGDADLYFTNLGPNRLFRNNGDGTFSDITQTAQVGDPGWSTSSMFFDYDRDGWLDLFVCNYIEWTPDTDIPCTVDHYRSYCTPSAYAGQSCRLYHNRADGSFEDITVSAGVYNPNGKSLGVALLDYDDDGWLDIAVANDTEPNFLYHNNGDGTFTDEAIVMGVAFDENGKARGSMGIDAADVYNDGGFVLGVGNFSSEMTGIFRISGGGYFSDRAVEAGVGHASLLDLTFGLFFFDFDLDGRLDLFHVNGHIEPDVGKYQQNVTYAQTPSLFWNRGHGTFSEVSTQVGLGIPGVGRGAAYGDYDGDGDLDVLVSNNGVLAEHARPWLLRNDRAASSHHYLRIRVKGVQSNRDGIGTKVLIKTGDRIQQQMVRTGGSYCSQSEMTLTFGLGDKDRVDSVQIIWPSGQIDRYQNVRGDQLFEVTEGENNSGKKPRTQNVEEAEIHYNRGLVYQKQGKLAEAIQEFREAIRLEPSHAQARNNLGTSYQFLGDIEQAIAAYRQAIQVQPELIEARHNLGNLYLVQGKIQESLQEYKAVVRIKPHLASAHVDLGRAYGMGGQLDEAITEFRTAIHLDPNLPQAYYALGVAYRHRQMFDEAIASLQKALESLSRRSGSTVLRIQTLLNLGYVYRETRDLQRAVRAFQSVIHEDAEHYQSYHELGVTYMKQERYTEAVRAFETALKLRPDAAQTRNSLRVARARLARKQK